MQTDGEIKIALKIDDDQVVLYKLNTSEPLEKIVNDICRAYKKVKHLFCDGTRFNIFCCRIT